MKTDEVRTVHSALLAHFVSADKLGDKEKKARIGVALGVIEDVFGKIEYDPVIKELTQ